MVKPQALRFCKVLLFLENVPYLISTIFTMPLLFPANFVLFLCEMHAQILARFWLNAISRQKVGVSGHPSVLPRFFFHLTGFSQKVGWGIGSDQVKYLGFLGVWASSRITVVTQCVIQTRRL